MAKYIDPAKAAKLPPTFTLSPFAKAAPPPGTVRGFSQPQTCTVTAQNGGSQVYTVTAVKSSQPNAFTWSKAEPGDWSEGPKWANNLADGSAPVPAGRPDYIFNFNMAGNQAVTNDLQGGLQLNQLNIDKKFELNLAGKRIALVTNSATGCLPQIHVNTSSEADPVAISIELAADTTVDVRLGGRLFLKGLISGKASLTLECPGSTENYQNWGVLRLENKVNSYAGGTIIKGGQLFLLYAEQGLGAGPVTLNEGAASREACRNP